jgi:enoyl-CoA hydratase/carnithine racemase
MRADRTVRVDEPSPGVRVITLDRPHRLNAMSGELISDLHRAIDTAAADEEGRVVVITGAGRGFCAGLDLKEPPSHRREMANVSPQSRMHVQKTIAAVLDAALAMAAEITANSPMGVWMTKEVCWSQLEVGSLQAGIDLENRTQIMTTFTRDHHEQITAFLGKRPPHYSNE